MKMKSWMKCGVAAALLCLIMAPTQAGAFGLGVYLGGKSGSVEDSEWDDSVDYSAGGIGVVFDTAVASDNVFNYRLQLGYAGVSIDSDNGDDEVDADRYEMTHGFGFALVRNEKVRLWVGPQVNIYGQTFKDDESDTTFAGFSIGPVIGINVHLGSTASLFAQLSARYGGYAYDTDGDDEYDEDTDGDGTEWTISGDIGVLFRLGSDK